MPTSTTQHPPSTTNPYHQQHYKQSSSKKLDKREGDSKGMGAAISNCCANHNEAMELKAKIHVLEGQIRALEESRLRDAQDYEQHVLLFACAEGEWKQERDKHRDEAARLRRRLMEEEEVFGEGKGWRWAGTEQLVEQMKEERARREEAVEKWKHLYLAIKTELDDLIHRTRQGDRFCWEAEEGIIEGLRRELKAKEETIEALRSHAAIRQKEMARREREIDILKQSLRILSNTTKTKRSRGRKSIPRSLRL